MPVKQRVEGKTKTINLRFPPHSIIFIWFREKLFYERARKAGGNAGNLEKTFSLKDPMTV